MTTNGHSLSENGRYAVAVAMYEVHWSLREAFDSSECLKRNLPQL